MFTKKRIHEKGKFSFTQALENLRLNPEFCKAGAVACFIGIVRKQTSKGEKVVKLEIEAYEEKANETLEAICQQLEKSDEIIGVEIHHYVGEFSPGEELVYVLVAGKHRQETFETLKKAVERYKKEAPIFKKEHIITKKGETSAYWTSEQRTGTK